MVTYFDNCRHLDYVLLTKAILRSLDRGLQILEMLLAAQHIAPADLQLCRFSGWPTKSTICHQWGRLSWNYPLIDTAKD